jgi:dinuclear metal center YbgI/SA1388 family protein
MATVGHIIDFWSDLAPSSYRAEKDNIGLLAGRRDRAVTRILVALDASLDVIDEAISCQAQMLLVHHPLFFSLKSANDDSYNGRRVVTLLENQIACLCLHTNLDAVPGGVNDLLAERCGLENTVPLCSETMLGRIGTVSGDMSAREYAVRIAQSLHCGQLRYCDGGRPVKRVAVGSGNSAKQYETVLRAGCDTFVTGDITHHLWQEAKESGVTLIDAGHHETEVIVCDFLSARTKAAFPDITVTVSRQMRPPYEVL